ncbi:MAG: glutamate synthase subunit alpha, partial [Elusimicrobia bacterium]|nr:glutamate synthase subunit alpha [Elusimicrobiota bacterium]MBD3411841.1 glutamate synthase subunit alpha [Elusimicrobiota bacterium]
MRRINIRVLDVTMTLWHEHTSHGMYDPRYEHDACGVGFVCNIKGIQSHRIIDDSLTVLRRLAHRGAVGADPKTGDGAGLLMQIPHAFFSKIAHEHKILLPKFGSYGTGMVFLPQDTGEREYCKGSIKSVAGEEGFEVLGWRTVTVDDSVIGSTAKQTLPVMEQVFIKPETKLKSHIELERRLYVIRKRAENTIRASELHQKSFFYITNLSSRTIAYKGLLMPGQLGLFFPELNDQDMVSSIVMVHSRYSTNTFPTWDLAQPFRYLAHNGEINTLRGNINWMNAREGLFKSNFFSQKDLRAISPVLVPGLSDSATIDSALELLFLGGRSLQHSMMMLIPEAWEHNALLKTKTSDFYHYHSTFMEPWDGPASIAFTDGERIGAVLDRNGLRPSRYIITTDDYAVMASEVGVLDIPASRIAVSGRLKPGNMFFIDTEQGRIIHDDEIKEQVCSRKPYGQWNKKNIVYLDRIKSSKIKADTITHVTPLLKNFGYTREDLKILIAPMARNGVEPTGSMGNDTPLAVLSDKPQLLYGYFKQLFAQVTNPAIDPIREDIVMSLRSMIGPEKNLFEETPEHCKRLELSSPILSDIDMQKIVQYRARGFKTKMVSLLFAGDRKGAFLQRLSSICTEAEHAIEEGYTTIVLSDRGVSKEYAALPALLAMGRLHHHLVRRALRTQIGIVLESGEPREVHHFALLLGYGADAINPYLAFRALDECI